MRYSLIVALILGIVVGCFWCFSLSTDNDTPQVPEASSSVEETVGGVAVRVLPVIYNREVVEFSEA